MSNATATRRATNANAATSAMPGGVVTTRRRAPMRIIAGLLAVALGFVVGAVVLSSLNKAVDVLSVARAVSAGSVLTDADLTTVSIVPADSLHVVTATRTATTVTVRITGHAQQVVPGFDPPVSVTVSVPVERTAA